MSTQDKTKWQTLIAAHDVAQEAITQFTSRRRAITAEIVRRLETVRKESQ